jgi:glutathione reductase (NADPH)
MTKRYDLVVLGAGNGGQAAAGAARKAGWSVAIVEERDVGGVCPNRGCVPKKVLVAAAETLDAVQRAAEHHVTVGEARLDWKALIARKRSLVGPLPTQMEASLRERGIDLVRGHGVFVGRDTVEVDGTRLEARHIVVATGSRPRPLPIEGAELLKTSDDVLEMDELPVSVAFIGAGVVALELGHVLQRAGAKVTVLEVMSRPLPRLDPDAVNALVDHSRTLGMDLRAGVKVTRLAGANGAGFAVAFEEDGVRLELRAQMVVNGAGRIANLDTLQLERAGVTVERGRVARDVYLRAVENPKVWIVGDALPDTPQLSPVATYEGRLVGHNLLHPEELRTPDYGSMPSAVFTIPALAQVGLTEEEAAQQGLAVDVKVNDLRGWISARTFNEAAAFAKVLVEKETRRIVGAHLLGHGAAEVVHLFAFAMRHGVTADALAGALYAYPTFSNDVKFLV